MHAYVYCIYQKVQNNSQIRLFRIISIPSNFFRLPNHVILLECQALDFRCQYTQRELQSISAILTQRKECLVFSVKDRYQLNYFICIKEFNAQTITSLKFNLFYFFIYCCQHHERKTTCLDIFLLSDKQSPNTSIYSAVFLAFPYYNYL